MGKYLARGLMFISSIFSVIYLFINFAIQSI